MDMMSGMGLVLLVGMLMLAVVVGVAVYLGVRAAQRAPARTLSARDVLQHRLAAGELTPEEYYERESALRDGEAMTGRRR